MLSRSYSILRLIPDFRSCGQRVGQERGKVNPDSAVTPLPVWVARVLWDPNFTHFTDLSSNSLLRGWGHRLERGQEGRDPVLPRVAVTAASRTTTLPGGVAGTGEGFKGRDCRTQRVPRRL